MDNINSIAAHHNYLCHADGSKCEDGCDKAANPEQLRKYEELDEIEIETAIAEMCRNSL